MATGINPITWLSKVSGASMPNFMKLDTFEVAWERREAETTKVIESVNMAYNGSAQSNVVDLSSVSDTTQYSFVVTVPAISKTTNSGVATVTANLDAKANADSTWTTVESKTTSGTGDDDSSGFQFNHQNTIAAYDNWRLRIVTTGGSLSIVNLITHLDVIYTGNQRRKVKNIIGSLETTHASTVTDDFDTFIDQSSITNPRLYVANSIPDADLKGIIFTGEYKVDRISADRGEGRMATVLLSLTQEGSWADE